MTTNAAPANVSTHPMADKMKKQTPKKTTRPQFGGQMSQMHNGEARVWCYHCEDYTPSTRDHNCDGAICREKREA